MAESLEQHYRRLLGLEEPWVVEAVDLDLAAQRVEIRLRAQVDTRGLKCPECGRWVALYDYAPESRNINWRASLLHFIHGRELLAQILQKFASCFV